MSRSSRPRLLRAAVAAVAISFAPLTMTACGSDVVDDGVEQEIEEEGGDGENGEDED